jgi:hypothetical protein
MLLSTLLVTVLSGAGSPARVTSADSLMSPGVSRRLAQQRAARIRNVRYDLTLDVSRPDTAAGRVTVPVEPDEQIVSVVVGHLTRATSAYLPERARRAFLPLVDRSLLSTASDTTRGYGVRTASLDALVRVASSPAMAATLDSVLDRKQLAGLPVGPPTRWAIVTRLDELERTVLIRRMFANE